LGPGVPSVRPPATTATSEVVVEAWLQREGRPSSPGEERVLYSGGSGMTALVARVFGSKKKKGKWTTLNFPFQLVHSFRHSPSIRLFPRGPARGPPDPGRGQLGEELAARAAELQEGPQGSPVPHGSRPGLVRHLTAPLN
jgi:hypothetical protein